MAVLLAAVRKTVGAGDQDTKDLTDAAFALAQVTCDIGSAMSSVTLALARRQIWLAQTALPENMKSELKNMPVQPRKVFHLDSQAMLVKAQESVHTRKVVKRAFQPPTARTAGPQHTHTRVRRCQEPWSGNTRQVFSGQSSARPGHYQGEHLHPSQRQRGRPNAGAPPPGVQGLVGAAGRIRGTAAEVHSQLCLDG